MATISITVPNNKADKVYAAFKRQFGHAIESPTSQEKIDFIKATVVQKIKNVVHRDETDLARIAAIPPVDEDVAS